MKTTDIIRRAGRSLGQAKARTLLTSLAISVGAFTVTVALAAGAGTQAYTNNLLKSNGDARSLNVFAKFDEHNNSTPKEYGAASTPTGQTPLTDKDVEKIKNISGITEATPVYSISLAYITRPDGNGKKYEAAVSIKSDRTATPLAAGTLENNQVPTGGVVVPEDYLSVLGFSDASDAIGKKLTLHFDKPPLQGQMFEGKDEVLTIAAVDKKTSSVISYSAGLRISAIDGKRIYEYQTAGSSQGNQYYGVDARVADDADVKVVKQAVVDAGYSVFSLQDIQEALFQFINVARWGAAGFGFLAILASVFGIINTQYISVLERTQQIGLMKALGARRRDIGRLFRYEAAWVGFLGGIIGTGFALLLGTSNSSIASALSLEPGTQLLMFDPLASVILIVSLMLVAVIAGYFPSRKAAKLDPIEALRTE